MSLEGDPESVELIIASLTFLSGVLIVYHHLVFPAVLKGLTNRTRCRESTIPSRGYRDGGSDKRLPTITVIVPAHNEEAVIADKIRNLAVLDYPMSRLKVLVFCDGCTDGTAAAVRAAHALPENSHLDLTVRELTKNRGKVAVLNSFIPKDGTELVALSDASAMISVDALLLAAAHFADDRVGVVSGTYRLLEAGSAGEAAYWRYQTAIKRGEAALGAPMGSHGTFYLIRRELFTPLPEDTINDDFILPMEIVAGGHRAIYDPSILALELECSNQAMDHHRRRRIAAGNLQQIKRMRKLLHPRYRGIAFAFASGKALRAVMPFNLLIVFLGSMYLAPSWPFFAMVWVVQCLVYGIAAYRQAILPRPVSSIVATIHYLVCGHVAGLIGGLRYLLGLESGRWSRVVIAKETNQ